MASRRRRLEEHVRASKMPSVLSLFEAYLPQHALRGVFASKLYSIAFSDKEAVIIPFPKPPALVPLRKKNMSYEFADGYRIRDQFATHFLTFTIVGWIDIFSRQRYRDLVIEMKALNFAL